MTAREVARREPAACRNASGNADRRGRSLELGEGEILGVVGESGSGKTTLALALLGFARPGARIVAGSVQIRGEELFSGP